VGRHERRASLARYRREAGDALNTYLVDPDQPLDVPILRNAARSWLDALPRCGEAPARRPLSCHMLRTT
jgi:hypothetical protein